MPLFLSHLLGSKIRDSQGEVVGRLDDLIAQQFTALPEIIGLALKGNYIPLLDVAVMRRDDIRLKVPKAQLKPLPLPEDRVFLGRDILDAQVVDIHGAKVLRVNDLIISRVRDRVFVSGIDIGVWGLMRRLGLAGSLAWLANNLRLKIPEGIIPWDGVAPIEKEASQIRLSTSRDRLVKMHPADLAEIIEEMGCPQRNRLFRELSDPQMADLLEESNLEMQAAILHEVSKERARDILLLMEPDEAADLLGQLPAKEAEALLQALPAEEGNILSELLSYKANTAGSLMTTSYIALPEEMTVGGAHRWFKQNPGRAEVAFYIYLTNAKGRLTGVTSIRHLLTESSARTLEEFSPPQLWSVETNSPRQEVIDKMLRYHLIALPVVDKEYQLIGAITVNDILRCIQGER